MGVGSVVGPVEKLVKDVGAHTPSVFSLRFLANGGTSTVTGYLLDMDGNAVSDFTATIPNGNGSTDPYTIMDFTVGAANVADVRGIVLNVTGTNDVYYMPCASAAALALFKANPTRGIRIPAGTNGFPISRVSTTVRSGDVNSSGILAAVDGLESVLGTTADATVSAGATGSISAKLRRATQGLEDLKSLIVLAAGENHIGEIGGRISNPSANFTRPNDTTAYASGDLVANSTTAGSVTAMSWTAARVAAGSFFIRRAKFRKSGTGTTNASFRLHLFVASPATITNGDNGAFSVSGVADYLGAFDVTADRAFTDGAYGTALPIAGSEINVKLASGQTIYGLIEARAAYTPTAQEVFTVDLEIQQN
jgi:hypothetical protein